MKEVSVPSYLQKYAKQDSWGKFEMPGGVAFPRLSVGSERFTAIDAEGESTVIGLDAMEFVILDINPNYSKVYYEEGYDPESPKAPTCYSDNGFSPDLRVFEPQSEFCHSCPKNAWGSAESKLTGKQVKACSDSKKLAVYVLSDKVEGVYQFRIPPASLKAWREYLTELKSYKTGIDSYKVQPQHVITRASWSKKKNVLQFELIEFLNEETIDFMMEEAEKEEHLAWIGVDSQSSAQRQRQLQHAQAQPVRQIAHEKPIDVEVRPVRTISQEEVEAAVKDRKSFSKRVKPEHNSRAFSETEKSPPAQEVPPKLSAMELAKQRARARIAAEGNRA